MFHSVKTKTVQEKIPLNLLSQEEQQWKHEERQPLHADKDNHYDEEMQIIYPH